jgi:hypothetical protein
VKVVSQYTIVSIVFALIGLILGIVVLVINPYSLAISLFVSLALFVMTTMGLANYRFNSNKNKPLHRCVILIEAIATITMLIEMLFAAPSADLVLSLAIFSGLFLFELYLGIDIWIYLRK